MPVNPAVHFLGVEADAGSYDVTIMPARMFSTFARFNQKTRDALNPPDVFLTTQDLGQSSDLRVDPLDEVCVQAQKQE
jgi:hypothetical protein